MSLDGILQAIRADSDARLRELADTTAAEVAVISARADEEARRAEAAAADTLDLTTEREVAVIVDRARLDARRATLRAIETAYQATLDDVRRRLAAVRDTPAYRDHLAVLLDEALRVVGDPSRVIVDATDVALVDEVLAERGVDCDVVSSPSASVGGLDLEAGDGRIVHNSLDFRLARADARLRAIVAGHLPEGVTR